MPEDKHYSKFEDVITCRNTSYYGFLGRIMRPKRMVSVPNYVAYVVNI